MSKKQNKEKDEGCVSSASGPLGKKETAPAQKTQETPVLAKVGKAAPDFEALALAGGKFTKIKLSDYLGKWVVLCFYPGDFTFV